MSLVQKLSLPFVDNFTVNLQIRIQPDGREYIAYVQADLDKWHRFRIGLTQHDIKDLNLELQSAIEHVSTKIGTEDLNELRNALSMLAEKGKFAFNSLFAKGAPRETMRHALKRNSTIQISSENFSIPWELLYDGKLGDKTDVMNFWGMQHIISRALIQDARPSDFLSPIIRSSRPRVGCVAYQDLKHVADQEIPNLRSLQRKKHIFLSILRSLDISEREEELAAFNRFLCKDLQIFHVACHAYEKKPISQSYFLVTDMFPITIEDFRIRDFEIMSNPVVILNACLTGTMNPLYTSNWAAMLWERGARGVLATEFRVPDWFAATFIKKFYEYFLLGIPIGESLHNTRSYFWNEYRNPLGLAYVLYSSPMIRIAI